MTKTGATFDRYVIFEWETLLGVRVTGSGRPSVYAHNTGNLPDYTTSSTGAYDFSDEAWHWLGLTYNDAANSLAMDDLGVQSLVLSRQKQYVSQIS